MYLRLICLMVKWVPVSFELYEYEWIQIWPHYNIFLVLPGQLHWMIYLTIYLFRNTFNPLTILLFIFIRQISIQW